MVEKLKQKCPKLKDFYIHFFMSGVFILTFVFLNVFLTTSLYIFKIVISPLTPILSAVLSMGTILYFLNKKKMLSEHKATNVILTIIIPLVIIASSIWINGKVLDTTWDGNSYQKATIGMLATGWNPLYEHIEDFQEKSDIKVSITDESPLYINHYSRGSTIYAANIYRLTGNIETGKSINTLSIIMIFLFTFAFLLYKNKTIFFSFLFSLCIATYPVICSQFLTNYLDLLVYVFLYLLILSFFLIEEKKFILTSRELLIIYFMILTLCINIKTSLFGYAGIFCLGYYIWYIYRIVKSDIDKKFFREFTVASICSVLIGVFIIGLSVYPKNFIDHGQPFYPLMGEGKVDIITQNQPNYFKEKSPIEKFVIASFSKVDDIIAISNDTAEFKIPFTINEGELYFVSLCDTRISGNGIFFGGILIISIIILALNTKQLYKDNQKMFILCAIPTVITILMIFLLEEAWWARYFPQIYFIVVFSLLVLDSKKMKFIKFIEYAFILVILVNNFITFSGSVSRSYERNKLFNEEFMAFENMNYENGKNIDIYTASFHGAKYNILDKYKNYNISFEKEKIDGLSDNGTFFGGYLEWGCRNE